MKEFLKKNKIWIILVFIIIILVILAIIFKSFGFGIIAIFTYIIGFFQKKENKKIIELQEKRKKLDVEIKKVKNEQNKIINEIEILEIKKDKNKKESYLKIKEVDKIRKEVSNMSIDEYIKFLNEIN